MRKNWKKYGALCLVGGMLLSQLAGCGSNHTPGEAIIQSQQETQTTRQAVQEEKGGDSSLTVNLGEGKEKTITYRSEDLDDTWDEGSAGKIILEEGKITFEGAGVHVDGTTAVIEKEGTYVVTGKLSDGQISIEAPENSTVHLVLNEVEMGNTTTSPIYASEKCKVILTLASGTNNRISDSQTYVYHTEGEDEPDAAIFTKGDLTINGNGSLQVYGNYQSGIRSKEDLVIASGNITVECQDDGIKGKDSVVIRDGILNITAAKDGIKSNNESDAEKGFIWIDGGVINIAAKDDGIQAETALIISGGEIDITQCQEGLAGRTVDILGGLIKANASDDGINSAASVETEQEKMMDQEGVYTRIAGGEIWLSTRADGIDSNGDLYMEGGTLYLTGPASGGDGILDYNGNAVITGGTMIAAGSSGMMQTFSETSTQPFLTIYYTETQAAGTGIALTDDSGNELAYYAPEAEFQAVIISTPKILTGNSYHVKTGENTIDMEVTGIQTVYGTAAGGRGGRFGNRDGGSGGMGRGTLPPDGTAPTGERPKRTSRPESSQLSQ